MGPNLIHNADCDQSLVLTGTGWGASTRFAFNGDVQPIGAYYSPFDGAGSYLVTVTYDADGAFQIRIGDSGLHGLASAPSGGAQVFTVSITDPATFDAINFRDATEEVIGKLVRLDCRKLS